MSARHETASGQIALTVISFKIAERATIAMYYRLLEDYPVEAGPVGGKRKLECLEGVKETGEKRLPLLVSGEKTRSSRLFLRRRTGIIAGPCRNAWVVVAAKRTTTGCRQIDPPALPSRPTTPIPSTIDSHDCSIASPRPSRASSRARALHQLIRYRGSTPVESSSPQRRRAADVCFRS